MTSAQIDQHSTFIQIFAHTGHPETRNDFSRSRAEKKIFKKIRTHQPISLRGGVIHRLGGRSGTVFVPD